MRADGPDVRTLGEIVSYAFGVRAQDYNQAEWDAWRNDDGTWIIGLRWQAGHTDNSAHFAFTPGPHGGSVTAIDEHAEDLLHPNTAPRGPRSVTVELASDQSQGSSVGDTTTVEERETSPGRMALDTTEPASEHATEDTAAAPDSQEHGEEPSRSETAASSSNAGKKNHPVVPAWEDVLLGVRSQRG